MDPDAGYLECFPFDGFGRSEPACFGSRRAEIPTENVRLNCRASASGRRFVFVEPGTVSVAVKGVDPEIFGPDLPAGLAQPCGVDAHDGGRFREEVEVGDRPQTGVDVAGIEQQTLPDESPVVFLRAVHADIGQRIVDDRFYLCRIGFLRGYGFDFELCRGACNAAQTQQEAGNTFHFSVSITTKVAINRIFRTFTAENGKLWVK